MLAPLAGNSDLWLNVTPGPRNTSGEASVPQLLRGPRGASERSRGDQDSGLGRLCRCQACTVWGPGRGRIFVRSPSLFWDLPLISTPSPSRGPGGPADTPKSVPSFGKSGHRGKLPARRGQEPLRTGQLPRGSGAPVSPAGPGPPNPGVLSEEGNPAGLSSCSGGLRPLVELCVEPALE